jgi:hypothetical protein
MLCSKRILNSLAKDIESSYMSRSATFAVSWFEILRAALVPLALSCTDGCYKVVIFHFGFCEFASSVY